MYSTNFMFARLYIFTQMFLPVANMIFVSRVFLVKPAGTAILKESLCSLDITK